MPITIYDRQSYKITSRQMTDEGFLCAPGFAARTGIQQYLACELGITDGDPNRIINVYRPAEEVFAADSLASYSGKDVTNNHPDEMVSSINYRELSVGHVSGPGVQDGDFVRTDLIVKDQSSIDDINAGKVELSAGYTAEYCDEAGVAPCGTPYEFVQRNIRINHVALVDSARAGQQARIFDQKRGKTMPKIVTLDNGHTVEVATDAEAALIQGTISRLEKAAKDALANCDSVNTQLTKAQATIDSQVDVIKDLEAKTSDSAIQNQVNQLVSIHTVARKAIKDYDPLGKSVDQIKRDVCTSVKPNLSLDGKSQEYIDALYDICLDQIGEQEEEEEKENQRSNDSHSNFAKDVNNANKSKETQAKDRATKDAEMSQSWRKTAGVAQ